jgi:hypothetical protein
MRPLLPHSALALLIPLTSLVPALHGPGRRERGAPETAVTSTLDMIVQSARSETPPLSRVDGESEVTSLFARSTGAGRCAAALNDVQSSPTSS